jgi:hypothetical protein
MKLIKEKKENINYKYLKYVNCGQHCLICNFSFSLSVYLLGFLFPDFQPPINSQYSIIQLFQPLIAWIFYR